MSKAVEAATGSSVMTVEEAAEELRISRGLAYEMARTGQLPVRRLGRRLLVPRRAFEDWLNRVES